MFISFFRYMKGYLKIRVTGYSPERFLNLCKNKNLDIWGLEAVHNAYEMYININGFRKLKPILRKTKTRVTIEERIGLPFFFYKYRKRTAFFIGSLFCILMIFSCTFFVWRIDVQGNQAITDEVLLEFLETKEIKHGMVKQKINCEQIAKDIRKQFDEIIWVTVSLEGTNLLVHIKENTDTFKEEEEIMTACDIISDKTGIITDIIVRSGVPKVQVGSEVKKGDLLVSGQLEVLNDAKEVVATHTVIADADITIETVEQFKEHISKTYQEKIYTKKSKTIPYLKLKEHMICFDFFETSYKKYDIKTKEKQLKMGDSFYFPVRFGKKVLKEYKLKTKEYTKEEMEKLLNEKIEKYFQKIEQKNSIILEKEWIIEHDQTGATANVRLQLREECGVRRKIVDF